MQSVYNISTATSQPVSKFLNDAKTRVVVEVKSKINPCLYMCTHAPDKISRVQCNVIYYYLANLDQNYLGLEI